MKERNIRHAIATALTDTPVVLVNGARQTGKTTLVREFAHKRKATFVTLDDHAALDAALNDPAGFITGLGDAAVIDEVQNAPNIFRAIKASVDRDRRPGRFLLTGSANVLALPKMSDSLAGRMEIITLYPMAQDELADRKSSFVDKVFATKLPSMTSGAVDRGNAAKRVFQGGYPEVMSRSDAARRSAWYKAYITTILQRDVRDISNIADLTAMPKLLAQLALRSSGLMNLSDIGRGIDAPHTTLRRYLALLETTFLYTPLRPWTTNRSNRLVKAPKPTDISIGPIIGRWNVLRKPGASMPSPIPLAAMPFRNASLTTTETAHGVSPFMTTLSQRSSATASRPKSRFAALLGCTSGVRHFLEASDDRCRVGRPCDAAQLGRLLGSPHCGTTDDDRDVGERGSDRIDGRANPVEVVRRCHRDRDPDKPRGGECRRNEALRWSVGPEVDNLEPLAAEQIGENRRRDRVSFSLHSANDHLTSLASPPGESGAESADEPLRDGRGAVLVRDCELTDLPTVTDRRQGWRQEAEQDLDGGRP